MQEQNYHTSITVDAPAHEAFTGINDVTKWWNQNHEGDSQKPGDEFTARFGVVHVSTQKLIEVIPDKKIVWLVTDSNLNFITNKQEWNNTKIIFEITEKDGKTKIDFTHLGLVREIECYNSCTKGWDHFIKGSLYKLLTEGKGTPGPF